MSPRAGKGSVYRDPNLLENRVRSLSKVFHENTGLDVPAVLTKAPELLNFDANQLTRKVTRLKKTAPELNGVAVSRVPELLLLDIKVLEKAREGLLKSHPSGNKITPELLLERAKDREVVLEEG